MIPLSEPNISGNEWSYVQECLDTGWVSTGGAYVERLEASVKAYVGSSHAVATNSGTAALHLSMLACDVRPGDLVLVPTLTFIAPVNAVRYVGADPVFFGCDAFLNLDVAAVERFLSDECVPSEEGPVERSSGRRVAAIVPVHVFGSPCDIARLLEVSARFGIPVIEDASESLGSLWIAEDDGARHTGTAGRAGVLSFNANKIVTTGGGGMLLTEDAEIAERARYLSLQAKLDPVRYVHGDIGFNYRMTNVAAAIGVAQLERLEEFVAVKRQNWNLYKAALSGTPGMTLIDEPPGTRSNRWFYSLQVDENVVGLGVGDLLATLEGQGIQTRPVWGLAHRQTPYRGCRTYEVATAEDSQRCVLNIPCSTTLAEPEVERVVHAIEETVSGRG